MSSLSVPDVLSAISNDKSLILFNSVALEAGNCDILKSRLELTRKQYYSRMSDLIDAGLIIRKHRKYFLTSFGKIVYEAQMIIGRGIQNYWKLRAIDSIGSPPNSPRLLAEEYNRFIDILVDCTGIKDILLRNNNVASARKEKVCNSQELIVSVPTKPSSM
jgi:predicted transcriptional regulator